MLLFLIGLGVLAAGAVFVALWRHGTRGDAVMKGCVAIGSVAAAIPAVRVLLTGDPVSIRVSMLVHGGDWVLGLDALSSVFLLVFVGVGVAATFYGAAYFAEERAERAVWLNHALLVVLIIALAVVVTAQAVLPFLGAWEVMAIASYLLIVTEHEQTEVRRAGLMYLVATHAGTLALFVMFALWSNGGSDWSFAALAANTHQLPHGITPIMALAIIGFGVKAGAVPFHFWLPPAHAAAPSHVSALMSGVVIKTGIYGLLRVVVMAGGAPAWWGWALLALGVASAVLGVLWALAQHDLKRLLAYHSVENIGIILMGVGVGALGAANGQPAIAVIGYAAAVLHTVNHALFKSVLFLGAGAVYRATGTRHIESLGGLARRMPVLALSFIVGSAAIVGVPPLNGFVSEWLVYQGLFRTGIAGGGTRLAVLAVPLLALVGGLALACFAKVVGVVFLGQARSEKSRTTRPLSPGLVGPPVVLALACVALGLFPVLVMPSLLHVGAQLAASDVHAVAEVTETMADTQRLSWFAFGIWGMLFVVWGVRALLLRGRTVARGPTWGCGFGEPTPRMQYTASSFATPLLEVFAGLSGVREHRGATLFHTSVSDFVLDRGVLASWMFLREQALRLRAIQHGRLHMYLLYVVVTLLATLAYFVFWPV